MSTEKVMFGLSAQEAQKHMLDQLKKHGRDALISAWPTQTENGVAYTVTVKVQS